jgi:hypothetical protein
MGKVRTARLSKNWNGMGLQHLAMTFRGCPVSWWARVRRLMRVRIE